jgi:hypothetical protein
MVFSDEFFLWIFRHCSNRTKNKRMKYFISWFIFILHKNKHKQSPENMQSRLWVDLCERNLLLGVMTLQVQQWVCFMLVPCLLPIAHFPPKPPGILVPALSLMSTHAKYLITTRERRHQHYRVMSYDCCLLYIDLL